MINQLRIFVLPLAMGLLAVLIVGYFSSSLPLNGICGKCGENLPRRGFTRCPWCGRLCLVLRFR